jgi:hypothetical protein
MGLAEIAGAELIPTWKELPKIRLAGPMRPRRKFA